MKIMFQLTTYQNESLNSVNAKEFIFRRDEDTFFFKCGENDFECHDTFDSESEMTSN